MVSLLGSVGARLFTRDFSWRQEFVAQCAVIIRRCTIPLAISAAAFIFGVVTILIAGELRALGALDRAGRGTALGATREFATWMTGMLVGGIAGTAICADLGARKVREELDAMAVLATDTIRSLVLPRYAAMAVMTPVMFLWTAFCGVMTGAIATNLVQGLPVAAYLSTASTLVTVDVFAALVKMALMGVLVATVFCFKGLHARGGAEGVGRAVNEAVVVVFILIFVFNYLFNSLYLGTFPEAQQLR